jgi:hypothetical protein
VRVDEHDDDQPDDPSWASPYVDGAWHRTANPNSADGELQNLAAFGSGLSRLSGARRRAVQAVVILLLVGVAVALAYGALGIVR